MLQGGAPGVDRRRADAPSPGQIRAFPTHRGRRTQAAIDAAARTVIARKGILATTIADIAAEAGRSAASFYNYYDSKEAMVRQWALRFRDEANQRALSVTQHGLSNRERAHEAAAAHWHTYRNRLAEMISVSQLAMVNDDFAQYWAEMCAIPISFHHRDRSDVLRPRATAPTMTRSWSPRRSWRCSTSSATSSSADTFGTSEPDDQACIQTLANIYYRAIYARRVAEIDSS